jgi:malonyl-CoA O-methyltransferase
VHPLAAQIGAARRVGLVLVARRVAAVGADVRALYADAGKLAAYEAQRGLPLVLALAFRRIAA